MLAKRLLEPNLGQWAAIQGVGLGDAAALADWCAWHCVLLLCLTCMMLLPRSLLPLNSPTGVPGQPLMMLHTCPTNVLVSIDTGTFRGT
jgi:hypothetical protein